MWQVPPARSSRASLRRGLSLMEVVVSSLLVGLLLTASLSSVGSAVRTSSQAVIESDAKALARQMLEEIFSRSYQDPDQSPVFGLESGESSGSRPQFDDIDDYDDRSESPPKDLAGNNMAAYAGWTRSVDIKKTDLGFHLPLADNAADTGLRLISVTVVSPTGKTSVLQAYRSKEGGSLQAQGVDQTLVAWVGVTLQSGNGGPVSDGTCILNHAEDR